MGTGSRDTCLRSLGTGEIAGICVEQFNPGAQPEVCFLAHRMVSTVPELS